MKGYLRVAVHKSGLDGIRNGGDMQVVDDVVVRNKPGCVKDISESFELENLVASKVRTL